MEITAALAPYATPASVTDLIDMVATVDRHIEIVRTASAERDFVDVALAERVAGILRVLVEPADDYTARERSLLMAAIRYFVDVDDVSRDLHSPTGLEDDTEILNAVCVYLGRRDLAIDLG